MTPPDTHKAVMVLRKRIEQLSRQRRTYMEKANALATRIEEEQKRLVLTMKEYAAEMGVQVSVRAPRTTAPKKAHCSICVAQGMPGDGHTAARHYALVVSGELPGLKEKEEV